MKFRTDINGLRAYAVIAVMLFHFNHNWLPGGFSGVDVFFVISGFLMTGIIFRGLEKKQFSIFKFYTARIRRIVPALMVVVAILLVYGYLFLTPWAYYSLSEHVGSSLLFFSNSVYKNEANYFDVDALSKYLLHTWSLSVEWQFYLIYPLIFMIAGKFLKLKTLPKVILTICIIGFFANLLISNNAPKSAYFLLPSRIWEMLLGAVAFLYPLRLKSTRSKYTLEIIGLLLIIGAFFIVSENTRWPGYMALLPTIGAFLLIQAANSTSIFTNNLLVQKIGLWSYSLYLYHWPLLSINNKFGLNLSPWAFFGITFILSLFSYYFIEIRKWRITTVIITFTIILITTGCIYCTHGAAYRTPEEYRLTAFEYHKEYYGGKNYDNITTLPFLNSDEDTFEYLIVGDSFARQYTQFIEDNDIKAKVKVADGCLIMKDHLTNAHYTGDGGKLCHSFSMEALSDIKMSTKPIIWAQNWIAYTNYQLPPVEPTNSKLSKRSSTEIIKSEISQVAEQNVDKEIFIIGTPIPAPNLITECLAEQYLLGYQIIDANCMAEHPKTTPLINQAIKSLAEQYHNIHYIDPNDILCDQNTCFLHTIDTKAVFSDLNHLSIYGAESVAPYIFSKINSFYQKKD